MSIELKSISGFTTKCGEAKWYHTRNYIVIINGVQQNYTVEGMGYSTTECDKSAFTWVLDNKII